MLPEYQIKYELFPLIIEVFESQENLARKINMEPSYLSKILRRKAPITCRSAYMIANALNVSKSVIFNAIYE